MSTRGGGQLTTTQTTANKKKGFLIFINIKTHKYHSKSLNFTGNLL